MIRLFYSSIIVFFTLLPGSGISAGLKSTSNQNLQHHRVTTLADCVAEAAPDTDLLSFQKKYRHKAEQKCREMLAEKRRKTVIITPTYDTADETDEDSNDGNGDDTAAQDKETPPAEKPHNYWRNNK